jgi:uncharacterized protein (DUF1697 family)
MERAKEARWHCKPDKGNAVTVHITLIRGIGGATHQRLTMRALEEKCRSAGLEDCRSLLATGNLQMTSPAEADSIALIVSGILEAHGLSNAIIMNTLAEAEGLLQAAPWPEAARNRPSQYQITFLSSRPSDDAMSGLIAKARHERIARIGSHIAIDYAGPISESKLTTTIIERTLRATCTARNWNTLQKLAALGRQMSMKQ